MSIILPEVPPGWRGAEPAKDVKPADIHGALARLAAAGAEWGRKVDDWLKTVPASIICPAGLEHRIDRDATSRESWGRKEMVPIYSDCHKCRIYGSRVVSRLVKAGVPKNLLHATVDNWRPEGMNDEKILRHVRRFIAGKCGRILILQGGVGLGKTHLAVGIMRERRCGRMVTQNGLLTKLRETYRDPYAENIIEALKKTRLLVLDEMGVSSGGRDELPALMEIIGHRYGQELDMVLTTNLELHEFSAAVGERLADRLSDAAVLKFTGQSKRGKRPPA